MKLVMRAAALLGMAALLPACSTLKGFQGFYVPFPNTVAAVQLRGSQVIPALGSGATGTATITVDGLNNFIDYSIDATGLVSVTAIEIRLGVPGTNGPVAFSIPLGAFPIGGRLQAANMSVLAGAPTFAEVCAQVADGNAYLLISTATFTTGEIRGHIGQAALASAAITGSQIPIVSPGSGSATIQLNAAQDEFSVTLSVSGLTGITGAQIFDAKPGLSGSAALFSLSALAFSSPLSVTLKATDFTPSLTVLTFPDAINALLSGGLYILVLVGTPTGELRGQIGPTQLNALLSGADYPQPVSTPATGSANVTLNATQTAFFVQLTHTVVSPVDVGIHAENPGSVGPKIFDVDAVAGAATSPLTATITPNRLIPDSSHNILSFPNAINALLTSQTYIQVTSSGFLSGEIRGQLAP